MLRTMFCLVFVILSTAIHAADAPLKKIEPMKRTAPATPPSPLGRNVKLTFTFKKADGVPAITVYSATTTYGIVLDYEADNNMVAIDLAGELHPVDSNPNALLLTYTSSINVDTPNLKVNLFGSGSTLVELGKEGKLLDVDGKTLVVNVDEVK